MLRTTQGDSTITKPSIVSTSPVARSGPRIWRNRSSGPYALAPAARFPERIAAAASFYGTWLVTDPEESPHLSLGKARGELYIACAEHDELAPLPMVEELRGLFERAGNPGELELYAGVHHGFAFPERKIYDKPAAERHWERLIALYHRRLG